MSSILEKVPYTDQMNLSAVGGWIVLYISYVHVMCAIKGKHPHIQIELVSFQTWDMSLIFLSYFFANKYVISLIVLMGNVI